MPNFKPLAFLVCFSRQGWYAYPKRKNKFPEKLSRGAKNRIKQMMQICILMGHADKKRRQTPDRFGSVGWVSVVPKAKGEFDSHSGHMPGLWVWSRVGGMQQATIDVFLTSMFLSPSSSLPFSLPFPMSKNKQYIYICF